MNILMTGGTGFIGSRLLQQLVLDHHHVYVLTRHPKKHKDTEYISYISYEYSINRLPFIHAVINLAGESLFGHWSQKKKAAILNSRVDTTEKLMRLLLHMEIKPEVVISGSAVGYYGMSEETIFTEKTATSGNDFLGQVCAEWEKAASVAEDLGIRTIYTRFGVVFDKEEGSLPYMALPFKLGAGGKTGKGTQWMSWIHIEDVVNLILFALYTKSISGPLNMTAPFPRQNYEFAKVLAQTLHRPSVIPVPDSFLRVTLGEMHQLMTEGQFVYPKKALDHGFVFEYPILEQALKAIYQ